MFVRLRQVPVRHPPHHIPSSLTTHFLYIFIAINWYQRHPGNSSNHGFQEEGGWPTGDHCTAPAATATATATCPSGSASCGARCGARCGFSSAPPSQRIASCATAARAATDIAPPDAAVDSSTVTANPDAPNPAAAAVHLAIPGAGAADSTAGMASHTGHRGRGGCLRTITREVRQAAAADSEVQESR